MKELRFNASGCFGVAFALTPDLAMQSSCSDKSGGGSQKRFAGKRLIKKAGCSTVIL